MRQYAEIRVTYIRHPNVKELESTEGQKKVLIEKRVAENEEILTNGVLERKFSYPKKRPLRKTH